MTKKKTPPPKRPAPRPTHPPRPLPAVTHSARSGTGEPTKEHRVSDDLLAMVGALSVRADDISARAVSKLQPIIIPALAVKAEAPPPSYATWPPLFDQLRTQLWDIEASLNRINAAVEAAEL